MHVSELLEDELIIIDIPIKSFSRAWLCIHYTFRNQINENDNVRIAFKKKSKQDIVIIDYEKLEPTQEHKEFAERNYKQPEPFKKTVIRESVEL